MQHLSSLKKTLKIAIIGSGQSAAEVLLDIHKRLGGLQDLSPDRHEIHLIIRNGSLKPSDDSPFVNEIFNPDCTNQAIASIFHSYLHLKSHRYALQFDGSSKKVIL